MKVKDKELLIREQEAEKEKELLIREQEAEKEKEMCCAITQEEYNLKEANTLKEVFARHEHVAYWYNRDTKKVIKGTLILPHEEDKKYLFNLLYIGNKESYTNIKKWGLTEYYSNGGNVACVGRNAITKDWYGWSHRGYGRFYIDYEVKDDSMLAEYIACGYKPKTEKHCKVLAHLFADLLD